MKQVSGSHYLGCRRIESRSVEFHLLTYCSLTFAAPQKEESLLHERCQKMDAADLLSFQNILVQDEYPALASFVDVCGVKEGSMVRPSEK